MSLWNDSCRGLLRLIIAPVCLWAAPLGAATAQQPIPGRSPVQGRSLIDRLSGFDQQRIAAVADWLQTPQDSERLADTAKLLFQINRLAGTSLATPPAGSAVDDAATSRWAVGDAVALRGTATGLTSAPLPPDLAAVLELQRIYRVEVQVAADPAGEDSRSAASPNGSRIDGSKIDVLTTSIPSTWESLWTQSGELDQPTAATGVVLQSDAEGRPLVVAAPSMAWFPTADSPSAPDWALLASEGFDVSLLDDVRSRNRKPLLAADHRAFYAMLGAANELASVPLPPPPEIDASALLRNATASVGRRIRLRCQSVRVTRITISNPAVRQQLGADHYWQLDALGELGNVVIRIETTEPETEPATFENRYPVSIVSLTLPEVLRASLGADQPQGAPRSDVAMVSRQLMVDGFFYRLWSYESDFMTQHGGGDQFGPLLMATRIHDAEPPAGDRVGVAQIGTVAAAAALVMLIASGLWIYLTARQDAAARARRLSSSSPSQWPVELSRDADD